MDAEVMCIHCLASISENQKKTVLSCGHRFHFACQFEHSMDTGSNSCLVCNNGEDACTTPLSNQLTQNCQRTDTQPLSLPITQPPSLPFQREVPHDSNYQLQPPILPRCNLTNTAPMNNTPQRQYSPLPVRPNIQSRNTVPNDTKFFIQQRPPFPRQRMDGTWCTGFER